MRVTPSVSLVAAALTACGAAHAQDVSPLKDHHVWLPMTGHNERQMEDARAAGYDTILLKIAPPVGRDAGEIDFASTDARIEAAKGKGFKVMIAILGWGGLGRGRFWDVDESGTKIPDRLDPFWPAAMEQVERYYAGIMSRYARDAQVVAFAPTWGIYGEAGFTSWTAGRSEHALARFNEWRVKQLLPRMQALPTRRSGPNTEFNRFIRFRYLYLEDRFDAMVGRLKPLAAGRPVGMWQELYSVAGYLWTMAEVPAADFALYEAAFPFQTVHHPEKSLAETMGLRYRCNSPEEYRQYYLPLAARKRGEGQRFMGCQLTTDYAVKNFGWEPERAERVEFDRWEDAFSPHLRQLMDVPLEAPERDVLLVHPTYASAALSDSPAHTLDAKFLDVLLRMHGCQMSRYGSARLDKMTVQEMNRFRLIVVPGAAYLLPATYGKLKRTTATVLFTGPFAQGYDSVQCPAGESREIDGVRIRYVRRPPGRIGEPADHVLTRGVQAMLDRAALDLPEDESFEYADSRAPVLLRCGRAPLVSVQEGGRFVFFHGQLLAALAWDPGRRAPEEANVSRDASAYEHDPWGPYSCSAPGNELGALLIRNLLDHAGVHYRVRNPRPRTRTRFLGDHMEQASVSANLAYNNTADAVALRVRLPWRPRGLESENLGDGFEATLTVPPYSYVPLLQE